MSDTNKDRYYYEYKKLVLKQKDKEDRWQQERRNYLLTIHQLKNELEDARELISKHIETGDNSALKTTVGVE